LATGAKKLARADGASRVASMVFAAIDVGSNAVRLKLARAAGDQLLPVCEQRDPVRPGEGVFDGGAMPAATATRLVAALREYAQLCRTHRARTRAVATSALREASNRHEVVARVRAEAGLELEIISGAEEARLTCLGALAGRDDSTHSLCLDVGGGSTEVVVARGERPRRLHSLEVGSARLSAHVPGDGPARVTEMRARVRAALAALPPRLTADQPARALGCSGVVRSLVEFAADGERRASAADLGRALARLSTMRAETRRGLFGAARAEVILAGAVIVDALLSHLGIAEVKAIKRGLRDGLLVEMSRESRPLAVAAVG
jgi:exopolyphosphatase/guanosine-5'-triphosphate,3'-diphosphate pyrophosphatase